MSRTERSTPAEVPGRWSRLRANSWPVLPMRVFLAALFLFAGYAKLSYPGFFDPSSPSGLKASMDAVKHGTPIGAALGPLSDHPSLFGHLTAFAEIAIGLGLLVGLLTRLAALGGMVLTTLIVLSIDWGGVKQYTGSSGWYTSVDLAVAAALSVFLLGGAGPLSLDWLIARTRARRRARDDDEPGFRDNELEDSRRRLQGEPTHEVPPRQPHDEYPTEENSLWNSGRREQDPARDDPARR
jgi:thiosulfate dehydrogenase [quinone] large subunit